MDDLDSTVVIWAMFQFRFCCFETRCSFDPHLQCVFVVCLLSDCRRISCDKVVLLF